ncbi:LINE-1 type transposase domain-containing 1 [Labeo rohita]|uniref:LINE-1 type transposase domain-containing 1 n=1 Tax=Labeo rohita TaxID=84645 RepID=A0A498NPM9_LABRO|nr:LINE-1 type transposase domain-containing 1 [Labeo rohita]RXN33584.1 LINE-1 type transposase domain-containing 1 [Labeo rohita]
MSREMFWSQSLLKMPKPAKKTRKKADELEHSSGDTNSEPELSPTLAKALEIMTERISSAIDEKLGPLAEIVHNHTQQLESATNRLVEVERRIMAAEAFSEDAQTHALNLEKQVAILNEHIEDLENRGRRKNIRILGLREEVEGTDAVAFLQMWIPKFLHLQAKNGRIKIERAHRTLAPKLGAKDRPWPLIVRFHNYGDKQKVLDASRMLSRDGDLWYDDNKVSFYQDFSASVIQRRKEFDAVKQRLREMGACYAMLYPAKLRVSIGNTSKVF